MSKAKKKARKYRAWKRGPHLSKIPAAPAPPPPPAGNMAAVRQIALPELWCKIEKTVHVTFLEKMRPDTTAELPGGRKRPAMLAKIHDHADGGDEPATTNVKDFAMPLPLAIVFASIPMDGYVGRSYRITRHRRHERKNASGFTVVEMETTQTGEAPD